MVKSWRALETGGKRTHWWESRCVMALSVLFVSILEARRYVRWLAMMLRMAVGVVRWKLVVAFVLIELRIQRTFAKVFIQRMACSVAVRAAGVVLPTIAALQHHMTAVIVLLLRRHTFAHANLHGLPLSITGPE